METARYYREQLDSIKNDLLDEIKELVVVGEPRKLSDIIYADGACVDWGGSLLIIDVVSVVDDRVMFENYIVSDIRDGVAKSEAILFDESTILRVLETLRRDVRAEKLDELRVFLRQRGDDFKFDGSFGFHAVVDQSPDDECVNHDKSMIRRIKIDANGAMYFCCEYEGELVSEGEGHLPFNELDDIISYVKSQVCSTMMLAFYRVENSCGYDRQTFDDIYDKPSEIIKKLKELDDEEVRFYDIETHDSNTMFLNLYDLVEDYNNELLDGGWWVVLIGRPKIK